MQSSNANDSFGTFLETVRNPKSDEKAPAVETVDLVHKFSLLRALIDNSGEASFVKLGEAVAMGAIPLARALEEMKKADFIEYTDNGNAVKLTAVGRQIASLASNNAA